MHARSTSPSITILAMVGVLLVGILVAPSPALAASQQPASDSPPPPLWTNWGAPQYSLADDGQSIWIGATGGVVRWDKAHNSYQRYSAVDGLPHSAVLAIAVDGAGNRWFGGDGGLSLLAADGVWTHYTVANSGLQGNLVDGIAVGVDHTLWVSHGLPDGRISRRNPDGGWSWFPNRAAAVTSDFERIVQSTQPNPLWTVVDGEVWVGFLVYTGSQWLDRTPADSPAHPKLLRGDSTGTVWALVADPYTGGRLLKWEQGVWSTIDLYGYLLIGGALTTFAVGPDNSVWLGLATRDFPYTYFVAAVARLDPNPAPVELAAFPPVAAMLASGEGVWAIGPHWLRTPKGDLHPFDDTVAFPTITDAILDVEDRLWLNSYAIQPEPYSIGALQTISDQGSTPLADDVWTQLPAYDILLAWERTPGGDLLSAWGYKWRFGWSYSDSLRRDRQGEVIEVPLPASDKPTAINDIFAQDDRHIWLAYTRGYPSAEHEHGVFALDDNGTPADFADDHWQDIPIATPGAGGALAVDAQGRLWYGNSVNLYLFTAGQWGAFFESTRPVCDLTPDAAGMLYALEGDEADCNTIDGAIDVIAPDNSYTSATTDHLVPEHLLALQAAPHRNRLWTVAPDGAVWYLARRSLSEADPVDELYRHDDSAGATIFSLPLAAAAVQRLEVDSYGHVWLVAAGQLW
ncbi:MAG TPA: hypothetical protein PKE45_00835, partial [Caldilineaceae bacterium]|nr:hypothetical protein [Caldilineaceae bacterium]